VVQTRRFPLRLDARLGHTLEKSSQSGNEPDVSLQQTRCASLYLAATHYLLLGAPNGSHSELMWTFRPLKGRLTQSPRLPPHAGLPPARLDRRWDNAFQDFAVQAWAYPISCRCS